MTPQRTTLVRGLRDDKPSELLNPRIAFHASHSPGIRKGLTAYQETLRALNDAIHREYHAHKAFHKTYLSPNTQIAL